MEPDPVVLIISRGVLPAPSKRDHTTSAQCACTISHWNNSFQSWIGFAAVESIHPEGRTYSR